MIARPFPRLPAFTTTLLALLLLGGTSAPAAGPAKAAPVAASSTASTTRGPDDIVPGAASVTLAEGWTFARGDDPRWATTPPDTAAPIAVNRKWEDAGHPGYDGAGWYFLRVPRSTLSPALSGDSDPVLSLGKIDDADEVFVNGTRIGRMGTFPPSFTSQWSVRRAYPLPAALLRDENLIAIRIWDGGGGGGLYEGVPSLVGAAAWAKAVAERFSPQQSFWEIPFANGLTSSKFNTTRRVFDSFREHIYSQYDEHTRTRDFAKEFWFGTSATPPEIRDAAYEVGTGIVRYDAMIGNRVVECAAFAPFTSTQKTVYLLVKTGREFEGPARFRLDLAIGPDDAVFGRDTMWVRRSADGRDFLTFQLISSDGRARGRLDGADLHVSGWGSSNAWLGVAITYTRGGPKLEPERHSPASLLARERGWWSDWHRGARTPRFRSQRERALFRQSLAVLKMAQCREPGRSHGQILASLPPGHWNICWIRDGAYAIDGLVHANRLVEAKAGLEFFLGADVGYYRTFVQDGRDFGVGVPYQISVCRYYGNGMEESDGGEDPNIELDGFGLFLWVLDRYVTESGDMAFLRRWQATVFEKVADAIIHSIEKDRDIIVAESGPWERHLRDNGYNGAKRFSYTSATAYQGLVSAARLADRLRRPDLAQRYRREAERLKAGFNRQFVDERGFIRGLQEETAIERCLDAGAVEGINFGVVDDAVAARTLEVFDRHLKKPNTVGYMRNDDGGDYDTHEWVVIDLRIATAFARLGKADRYEALVDWVTAQSAMNYNLIGELYSHDEADYTGAVPMCGFGPGAYISTLFARPTPAPTPAR